jgi:hypothetical protein
MLPLPFYIHINDIQRYNVVLIFMLYMRTPTLFLTQYLTISSLAKHQNTIDNQNDQQITESKSVVCIFSV